MRMLTRDLYVEASCVTYRDNIIAAPTPEQRKDDGRADGIRIMTLEQFNKRKKRRVRSMAKAARLCCTDNRHGFTKCKRGIRINGGRAMTLADACEKLGVSVYSIYAKLNGQQIRALADVAIEKCAL